MLADVGRWTGRDHLAREDRIAMVLGAVEKTLYSSKVEALTVPSKLSIEHVIPEPSWV
jgi:hypothetical protein